MKTFMKRMHGEQKGFTLIELLVVIAILGVIAAVVALNVAGFFGRGTLQAANTELHQAQTAIIAAMADAESNTFSTNATLPCWWAGEDGVILLLATSGGDIDASDYVYGPFRAAYWVDVEGGITNGVCYNEGAVPDNPWGPTIIWEPDFMNWRQAEDGDY